MLEITKLMHCFSIKRTMKLILAGGTLAMFFISLGSTKQAGIKTSVDINYSSYVCIGERGP